MRRVWLKGRIIDFPSAALERIENRGGRWSP